MQEESDDHAVKESLGSFLSLLGLRASELEGKRILDVGAGNCSFARILREEGITDKVTSIDHQCRSPKVVDEPSFRLAEAQFMPFEDNEFDFVFAMNSIPFVSHTGLFTYGKPLKVDEQCKVVEYSSDRADSAALHRKERFLRIQAVRECIRVVKPAHQVRLVAQRIKEVEISILGAVDNATLGSAEVLTVIRRGKNQRFILVKN